ncbi:hypothetical protein LL965_19310 [Xanthomonas cassavae CFBP 4642]|uniref:Uncharacterized protein n=1 Tax=Xanthomonas cassavae CFBP 4642 TaxID=1219375 RepID=A0ABS8HIQ6_9XANT|nr:hypothetical protein [Xanthomonas cassavae]MCC4622093.1 hypothetical protein [Xanthomonas cassavae CFBP 4642]
MRNEVIVDPVMLLQAVGCGCEWGISGGVATRHRGDGHLPASEITRRIDRCAPINANASSQAHAIEAYTCVGWTMPVGAGGKTDLRLASMHESLVALGVVPPVGVWARMAILGDPFPFVGEHLGLCSRFFGFACDSRRLAHGRTIAFAMPGQSFKEQRVRSG